MKDYLDKFSHWYFSRRALPYWGILLVDCLIIFCSGLLVFAVNHGALYTLQRAGAVVVMLLFDLLIYGIAFRLFHTYSGIIRYSSFVDLQRVGTAMVVGTVLIFAVRRCPGVEEWFVPMYVRDLVAIFVLSTLLMWAVRMLVKFLYDNCFGNSMASRAFIYGVKFAGIALAKSIRNQKPSPYRIEGFVSDESEFCRYRLMGVKVYPNDERLVERMLEKKVKVLLVSPMKSDDLRENETMVNRLIKAGIKIYMLPRAVEWGGREKLDHTQLKEVDIEDLLPRDAINIDMKAVGGLLAEKKILITGAAGSIGSEMVRQIAVFGPAELILVDQAETPLHDIRLMMARRWPGIKAFTLIGDISNRERMRLVFEEHRPDYVFHAAAYKHVPMMEDNPSESIQNNVAGTRVIADLAVQYGTRKFVMISTDKAVNPTNVMGCSKRICEIYVQSLNQAIREGKVRGNTCFVTTRFGNVLGSNGSVIPLFKEQIRNGGPVTVTHPDIIRFFMLIPEACKLVLEAGTMGKGGEIFVFDMGKPVKIVDLAKRMIYLSGAQGVQIKFTGLREGEKLYEEVLNDAEVTLPTFHPKIKIARVREYDYGEVSEKIDEMVRGSFAEDDMQIVKRMKDMVPEFKSQHSKYEFLDK